MHVEHKNLARVQFPDGQEKVPVGKRISVYLPENGQYVLLGEMEVSESAPGSIVVRPVGPLKLSALSQGAVLTGL